MIHAEDSLRNFFLLSIVIIVNGQIVLDDLPNGYHSEKQAYVGQYFSTTINYGTEFNCNLSRLQISEAYSHEQPSWLTLNFRSGFLHGIPQENDVGSMILLITGIGNNGEEQEFVCKQLVWKVTVELESNSLALALSQQVENRTDNLEEGDKYLRCLTHPSVIIATLSITLKPGASTHHLTKLANSIAEALTISNKIIQVIDGSSSISFFRQLKNLRILQYQDVLKNDWNGKNYVVSWPLGCDQKEVSLRDIHTLQRRSLSSTKDLTVNSWHLTSGNINGEIRVRKRRAVFFGSITALEGTPLETSAVPTKIFSSAIFTSVTSISATESFNSTRAFTTFISNTSYIILSSSVSSVTSSLETTNLSSAFSTVSQRSRNTINATHSSISPSLPSSFVITQTGSNNATLSPASLSSMPLLTPRSSIPLSTSAVPSASVLTSQSLSTLVSLASLPQSFSSRSLSSLLPFSSLPFVSSSTSSLAQASQTSFTPLPSSRFHSSLYPTATFGNSSAIERSFTLATISLESLGSTSTFSPANGSSRIFADTSSKLKLTNVSHVQSTPFSITVTASIIASTGPISKHSNTSFMKYFSAETSFYTSMNPTSLTSLSTRVSSLTRMESLSSIVPSSTIRFSVTKMSSVPYQRNYSGILNTATVGYSTVLSTPASSRRDTSLTTSRPASKPSISISPSTSTALANTSVYSDLSIISPAEASSARVSSTKTGNFSIYQTESISASFIFTPMESSRASKESFYSVTTISVNVLSPSLIAISSLPDSSILKVSQSALETSGPLSTIPPSIYNSTVIHPSSLTFVKTSAITSIPGTSKAHSQLTSIPMDLSTQAVTVSGLMKSSSELFLTDRVSAIGSSLVTSSPLTSYLLLTPLQSTTMHGSIPIQGNSTEIPTSYFLKTELGTTAAQISTATSTHVFRSSPSLSATDTSTLSSELRDRSPFTLVSSFPLQSSVSLISKSVKLSSQTTLVGSLSSHVSQSALVTVTRSTAESTKISETGLAPSGHIFASTFISSYHTAPLTSRLESTFQSNRTTLIERTPASSPIVTSHFSNLSIVPLSMPLSSPTRAYSIASSTVATKAPNTNPIVVNSIGRVTAYVGRLLAYKIPFDTFYDRESGYTPNLILSCRYADGRPLEKSFWIVYDNTTQTLSGLPFIDEYNKQGIDGVKIEVIATDKSGGSARDVFNVYIESLVVSIQFALTARISRRYPEFEADSSLKVALFNRIIRFYNTSSSSSYYASSLTNGSVIFSWSDTTISGSTCNRSAIASIFRNVQLSAGSVTSQFAQAMLPDFPILGVTLSYHGVCLVTPTTPAVPVGPVAGQRTEDVFVTYVVPTIAVALVLALIIGTAIFLSKRRRTKPSFLEKSTFKKGRPVLLPEEYELDNFKGPAVTLPEDYIFNSSNADGGLSTNSDRLSDDGYEDDKNYMDNPIYGLSNFTKPPPAYNQQPDTDDFESNYESPYSRPPPSYQLPPLYLDEDFMTSEV